MNEFQTNYLNKIIKMEKEKKKFNDEFWDFDFNRYELSKSQKLILKVIYTCGNIFLEDLGNIFKPLMTFQTLHKNIKEMVKLKLVLKEEKFMGFVVALNASGNKLFTLNDEKSKSASNISEKQIYLNKTIHGLLAERVLIEYTKPYIKSFSTQTKEAIRDYLSKQYIKSKIYIDYINISTNKEFDDQLDNYIGKFETKDQIKRYLFLLSYDMTEPEAFAIASQNKKMGHDIQTQITDFFFNNVTLIKGEIESSHFFKRSVAILNAKSPESFDILYDYIQEKKERSKFNMTDDEDDIKWLTDFLKEMDNNFLNLSDNKIRKQLKEVMVSNNLDLTNLKAENDLNRTLEIKSSFSSYHSASLQRLKRLKEVDVNQEDLDKESALKTYIEEKIEPMFNRNKLSFRILSYKMDKYNQSEVLNLTFSALRLNGIYVVSIDNLNINIAIIDNVADSLEPHLIFHRIFLAYYFFKEIDSNFKLNFTIYCATKGKESYVKNGIKTVYARFDNFKDEGFGDVKNCIAVKRINKIENEKHIFYKRFLSQKEVKEDEKQE